MRGGAMEASVRRLKAQASFLFLLVKATIVGQVMQY